MNADKTGRLIAEKRKELNLNQSQLAELLHVSDKAVSRWETGRGFPDISILEDLSDALHISIYELLKGEADPDSSRVSENEALTKDSLNLFTQTMNRKKTLSFIFGFLIACSILILLLFHINAPIYPDNNKEMIRVEQLSDKLVAIISGEADGYDLEEVDYEGRKEIFLSIYQTTAGRFRPDKKEQAIIIGETAEIDAIYLYPGKDGDILLYSNGTSADQGVITLPRLIYNYWLLIAAGMTVISLILYLCFRKKYYANKIFDYLFIPSLALTVSMVLVLWGNFDKVYNAAYYFSGILLLSICFIFLYHAGRKLFSRR